MNDKIGIGIVVRVGRLFMMLDLCGALGYFCATVNYVSLLVLLMGRALHK